jgi:hypothetical protein
MIGAGHLHVLGLGKPGQDDLANFREPRTAVAAADV